MKPIDKYNRLVEIQKNGHHTKPADFTASEDHTCLNCGSIFKGNFCPNCGQDAKTKRLSIMQGIDDLLGIFTNFDRGFLHTCAELFYRPGYMIADYLDGHRKEYVKPIQLIFLLSTIMILLHLAFYGEGFNIGEDTTIEISEDSTIPTDVVHGVKTCINWLSNNMPVFYMILVSWMVIPNSIVFRRASSRHLTISEHFFTMIYIGCQFLILNILFLPIEWLLMDTAGNNIIGILLFGNTIPLLILIWDMKQLYQISYGRSIWLCLLSNALAFLLITILIVAIIMIISAYN